MPTQFSQTTRSLANDRSPAPIFAWLWDGPALRLVDLVRVWRRDGLRTSRKARLEVIQLPHHVAASLSGRIVIDIGDHRTKGAREPGADRAGCQRRDRLRLAEEETRLTGAAAANRIDAGRTCSRWSRPGMRICGRRRLHLTQQGPASRKSTRRSNSHEATKAGSKRQSAMAGGVAEIDALRAASEADKLSASKDALTADLKRSSRIGKCVPTRPRHALRICGGPSSRWKARWRRARATIARIQQTIDRHVIRAPVAGRIGDAASLYTGAYVAEGQRLFSVVPPGELMIVGDFNPPRRWDACVRASAATMRLDGFPWAQYRQHRRDGEPGRDRERATAPSGSSSRPAPAGNPTAIMQHGVPGVIEVAVEQTAPALLVLRAAGLLLSGTVRQATASPAELAR